MKRLLFFFFFTQSLFIFGGESRLETAVSQLPEGKITLTRDQFSTLITWSIEENKNLFQLLSTVIPILSSQKKQIIIPGDLYRWADEEYRLGGSRIEALLPIKLMRELKIGALLPGESVLEIKLTQPHQSFLELGDFSLQQVYGFKKINGSEFVEAYGVQVKVGFFWSDIEKLVLVSPANSPDKDLSPHFIALYVKFLPRPKQWKIPSIRMRSTV